LSELERHVVSSNHPDVLDLVEESVIVFGLDERISVWNAASERMYGWKRDEVFGRRLKDTVRCSPPKPHGFLRNELCRTGRWEGELMRVGKNRSRVFVRATWSLRRDRNGEPKDIVETCVDVTAARNVQEALRQAESRYLNLFRAAATLFCELEVSEPLRMIRQLRKARVRNLSRYLDEHHQFVRDLIRATRILAVSERAITLFGRGSGEMPLESLEQLWPHASTGAFAEGVIALLRGSMHHIKETSLRDVSGREFDALLTACICAVPPIRGRMLLGIIDVSKSGQAAIALQQSEARYRNLFEFMPIPLWRINRRPLMHMLEMLRVDGVKDLDAYIDEHPDFIERSMNGAEIVEVNHRAVELMGANRAEDLLGPAALLWKESPETWRKLVISRFTGGTAFELEIKVRTLSGRIVDVLYFTAFDDTLYKTGTGVIGIVDISERVRTRGVLAKAQAELAHAARISTLGELTTTIANELNQPLTAIAVNGEQNLRRLDRPDPDIVEVRRLTAQLVASANRAGDVIRRIRGLAVPPKLTAGQSPTSLNCAIEEAVLFLRNEFQRNGIVTTIVLTPDLPPVLADRIQLQQVVINLAVNAIQALTKAGELQRHVTIRTGLANPQAACVEVEDNGPGVANRNVKHLFETFFTTKPAGMGIGLAICRTIIEAHGGTISFAHSAGGRGACFLFTLPVLAMPESDTRPSPSPRSPDADMPGIAKRA
jgi:PAS domain S-box-containing protein